MREKAAHENANFYRFDIRAFCIKNKVEEILYEGGIVAASRQGGGEGKAIMCVYIHVRFKGFISYFIFIIFHRVQMPPCSLVVVVVLIKREEAKKKALASQFVCFFLKKQK